MFTKYCVLAAAFPTHLAQCFHIMSIHHQCIETEALQAGAVNVHFVLEGSGFRLAQAVDVEDCHQVVQFLDASKAQCLPDAAFSTLPITNQAVCSEGDICSFKLISI